MKFIRNVWKRIKNSRRRTKIIGIIIIIVLVFFLRGRSKPVEVKYGKVTRGNIEASVSASGTLSGKNVATLHFNSVGTLAYLGYKSGDMVVKGYAIARIDTTTLNAAYQEALNNRRSTQANVDAIHDQVKDHTGDETFAQKATRTQAETLNDNAYNGVLAAQKALLDATIYAPFSGVIVAQDDLSIGQNITPTNTIAQVVDFSQKQFEISVDQSDIASINISQKVKIIFDAYPDKEIIGKISQIGTQIQKDATGAVTILVKSTIEDKDIKNIFGLEGQAIIITDTRENVLTISQDALIDDNHVYVKSANGKFEKKEIKTGIRNDTDIEVTSGLSENDEVVINPQDISK